MWEEGGGGGGGRDWHLTGGDRPGSRGESEGEDGKEAGGMARLRDRWRHGSRRPSPGRQTADMRSEPPRDGNKGKRGREGIQRNGE